jgi:hypothetical protein
MSLGTNHAQWAPSSFLERRRGANQAWFEEIGGDTGWFVDLLVHHGDAPVGSDRGVLWIEDERLYFSGHRTSFGLTAEQAADFCQYDVCIPGLKNCLELRLRHQTSAGPLGISFSPIDRSGRMLQDLHLPIQGSVNRWIGRGNATDGQLPPLTVGPDAEPSACLLFHAVGSVAFWIGVPTSLILTWNLNPIGSVVLGMAGLILGSVWTAVWSPQLRMRAWKDRRKLGVQPSRRPPQSGALA